MKIPISPDVKLDVMRLVESRLLIQASSGGGKSMTLRTILEGTFGLVPHIILDVEGEFSSLREKYDYILAGKDGDIPADPRTAQLLARKMLELNASIIIDLYELKHGDKHRFVRLFLEAMIDAPKKLWDPRLVVIDEAHQFCPEKGAGTSEAWETVIDLCEKGRKRGLGTILATQRLSKLNKDAAAECQNKVIGLANIDIDRERSAKELGFTHKEHILSLRDLEPGEFYCIGPALCRQVTKTKINLAKTSHPKIGKRTIKKPVATKKVLHLLEKIKDLPKEAEQELKTVTDMRTEIQRLRQELALAKKPILGISEPKINVEAIRRDIAVKYRVATMTWADGLIQEIKEFSSRIYKKHQWSPPEIDMQNFEAPKIIKETKIPSGLLKEIKSPASITHSLDMQVIRNSPLGESEKKILGFLILNPSKAFTQSQIGPMVGMKWKGGSFRTYVSRLRTKGFISGSKAIQITSQGQEAAAQMGIEPPNDLKAGLEGWLQKLTGNPRKIYDVLLANPHKSFLPEEMEQAAGMACTGGSFRTYVSRLCTIGLAIRDGDGIRLNPELRDS